MKRILSIMLLLFATSFTSCVLSKRSTDKSITKDVKKHPGRVREAAEFAVLLAYDKKETDFEANDVQDKRMREKISGLGSRVYVNYKRNPYTEIPDSNVTFQSITLFGMTEIIYDFASSARSFSDKTDNWRQYYFVKIADRIYYRRTPVPMM